jgi:hypothetical protein
MPYTMKVVEIATGIEHELPADVVTRDTHPASPSGPILPLAFRPAGDSFYVTSSRWLSLAGKPVRLNV